MPLFTIPLPKQAESDFNVRIKNSNAVLDWMILNIERIGEVQYTAIAIEPNSSKELALPPGDYHFFFTFQKIAKRAQVDIQIFTSHANSPFPATPRKVGAASGQFGLTGITVQI